MKANFYVIALVTCFMLGQFAMAQDVAFFSLVKGKVTFTDSKGKQKTADLKTKIY